MLFSSTGLNIPLFRKSYWRCFT